MSYDYQVEKQKLFTDEGQRTFLMIRDWAKAALNTTGAFTLQKAMNAADGGDSFTLVACVDRLVELGEVRLACQTGASQYWIYVRSRE